MAGPNSPHVNSPGADTPGQTAYDACDPNPVGGWKKAGQPVPDWPGERGSGAVDINTGRLTGWDNWVETHRTEQTEGGWRQT